MADPRSDDGLAWIPVSIALAATAVLYVPVVALMASEWAEFPSLSHGFAVPFIAAYLLWQRRASVASAHPTPSTVGFALLVPALLLLAMGSLGGEPFLARVSLPIALFGVVLTLGGTRLARTVTPGLAYLFLMIPLPYLTLAAFTYKVQLLDATIATATLRWFGLPVLREGVMIHLPNLTLEVAQACSSVQAIVTLLALGVAYAQTGGRSAWARLFLAMSSVPLGLASNAVRITLTALMAFRLGPVALDNDIHRFSGTTVFLLTLVLLVGLDSLFGLYSRKAALPACPGI